MAYLLVRNKVFLFPFFVIFLVSKMVHKSWSLKESLAPAEISQENNSFLTGNYHLSQGIICQAHNFTQTHNTAEANFTCPTDHFPLPKSKIYPSHT